MKLLRDWLLLIVGVSSLGALLFFAVIGMFTVAFTHAGAVKCELARPTPEAKERT